MDAMIRKDYYLYLHHQNMKREQDFHLKRYVVDSISCFISNRTVLFELPAVPNYGFIVHNDVIFINGQAAVLKQENFSSVVEAMQSQFVTQVAFETYYKDTILRDF